MNVTYHLFIQCKSHMCLQIDIDQLTDAIQTGSHNTQRCYLSADGDCAFPISRDTDKVVDQLSRQKRNCKTNHKREQAH